MSGRKKRPSAVYAILGKSGLIKIGRSHSPQMRLRQLGNPKGFILVYTTDLLENAHQVETAAHASLANCRIQGEWFRVSTSEAIDVIRWAVETAPLTTVKGRHRIFTMRVDDAFFDAVDRLRGMIQPIPTKSEVVRMALVSELAARLEEKAPA